MLHDDVVDDDDDDDDEKENIISIIWKEIVLFMIMRHTQYRQSIIRWHSQDKKLEIKGKIEADKE